MTHEEFFALLERGFHVRVKGSPINQDLKGEIYFVKPRKFNPYEGVDANEIVIPELHVSLRGLAEFIGCDLFQSHSIALEIVEMKDE